LQLQKLTDLLTERGESLPKELEFQEQGTSGSKGSGQGLPAKKKPALNDVDEDPVAAERRDKVKDAMLHAWASYEKYAWGMDELKVYIHTFYICLCSLTPMLLRICCFFSCVNLPLNQ